MFLFSGTFFPVEQLPGLAAAASRTCPALARLVARAGRDARHHVVLAGPGARGLPAAVGRRRRVAGRIARCAAGWWSDAALALAAVVVERNVVTYRRQWIAFLTGFLEPVFYLFSLGLGLGALIGDLTLATARRSRTPQFVAPAMLALSAMNGAVFDATYNMFFKLKYMHTFEAMLATPVGPRDIALGEMLWSLVRSGSTSPASW